MTRRVHIDYSDGRYTLLGDRADEPYADLWLWQWWAYCGFRWLDRRVDRWIAQLDRDAFARRDRLP